MTLPAAIKSDFPLLDQQFHDHQLVYLDSANTSQKPQVVIDAMADYYENTNANVHRGSYELAVRATAALEGARAKVASFINAKSVSEVVFTKNATESMNLLARSWAETNLSAGDAVVISEMEHHANIVPWHMLRAQKGIDLRWIPVDQSGHLDLSSLDRLLDGAKLLSVTAMSNVLGTLNPITQLSERAHAAGALMAVDASQYVPHMPTDVQALGADFLVFTGHKMLAPMGIGVLWARAELLDAMPPFLGGGEMILNVTKDGFTANEIPWKFEAGTPMVAEAVGLGRAVDYLSELGMDNVRRHEVELTAYALRTLTERHGDKITIHGPTEPAERGGVMSFIYGDVHPHDVAQVLDQSGIAVRAGHHCAKPLMDVLGTNATSRASLYVYNDKSDLDKLADALSAVDDIFSF
ncbi:MAG: SufS family cysteine desulfurase [Acidimicrobiaceae bacterium]|nr:SufS family cysteine desulfurase [Acidimicrobiaceae bacterium]MDE0606495.1 SufS family cysteine desulfurase [Acidimicrobiaceae bacterium]